MPFQINDAKYHISICLNKIVIVSSLHEVVKKLLLLLFIVVERDWLTKHSMIDCCCLKSIRLINSCVGAC